MRSRAVCLAQQRRVISVAAAVAAFLTEHQLSPGSQRVYAGALHAVQNHLGADTSLAELDEARTANQFTVWFHRRYGETAPATRVRQLAILSSACAFWHQRAWLVTNPTSCLERPAVPADRTRALTREQIASLWRRHDVALRERALWRVLYETAARANEILSLDVKDLDLPNKRARVRSKGGATEWVFWQTGAALLLPRLLEGRTTGPVFLADRQPTRAVPTVDRCPLTGRARLSYRRAAELFSAATQGWTLHQLRHSALTHAAEDGTNTPILLARSRHASVRSLERYARPGPEAVARHVAEHDPARRRR
ncbi:MAG: site-specific integrase [Chloroflexi bacterium]|nr:site-specific integrase [Chloroflexota bacterium]